MIITCIGGPDVGKSSLISRILINSGAISTREINKEINKSKAWLSNLVDTDYNEQNKGITIHSTQEKFIIEGKEFKILNNPGHEDLTNEMIINSSKSDLAMLLISAKPNETLKSIKQGYEHTLITRVNGINHLIVCINKSEYINSDNTYEKIVSQVQKSLKGHNYIKTIFIPISAKLDINISKNDSTLVNYCLFDIIKNIKIHRRESKTIKAMGGTLKCKLYFHNIPSIIAIGFKCILHSLDKLFTVEFINIENGNYNFVTKKKSKGMFIACKLKIDTNEHLDYGIILRSDNKTLAYGILY